MKKIVEMYGGKIWLESEVGKGTTFFWTFPKAGTAEQPEEPEVAAVSAGEDSNETETGNNESDA
ncbi:MAG: hypothetical protein ABSH16_11655 [Sedimentisphaerales bacterium]